MPPKQQDSKKSIEKKKAKIVEDKTFGLKNKNKSKKVQQYVKNVEQAVSRAGKDHKAARAEELKRHERDLQKKAKEAAAMEAAELFKTVVAKTVVPAGVDPKSVLCEFFKAGKCQKGAKCKFSHDAEQARKTAKIDLYSDPRMLEEEKDIFTDQSKLEALVNKKQRGLPPTDIVCKYFLDAIENKQYGWFWECPSGVTCHYRHCLPPGYVLKTKDDAKQKDDDEEEETIEEKIEAQRKLLDLSKCTPVTLDSFNAWKLKKQNEKIAAVEQKRKEAEKKGGSGTSVLSGRDLFRFDPSLFVDDADADDENYVIQEDADEELDDVNAKNYDSDDGDEKKDVNDITEGVNKDLFLEDEQLPDDDDDDEEEEDEDGDEDDDEEEEEEKKD